MFFDSSFGTYNVNYFYSFIFSVILLHLCDVQTLGSYTVLAVMTKDNLGASQDLRSALMCRPK